MHSRQIRFVFISALLVAAARADEPKPAPKITCNAPAAECERAIRSLASGRRYLGALVEELPNGGVRITSIATDSPAQRGGLGEGDRFMVANGRALVHGDVKEFKHILSDAKDNGWVSFIVVRHRHLPAFVTITSARLFTLPYLAKVRISYADYADDWHESNQMDLGHWFEHDSGRLR